MSSDRIIIHKPECKDCGGCVRLSSLIDDEGIRHEVWFSVEKQYAQYLCSERSDAFLIALLSYAMRKNCDIECEAPVTAQLLYQIRTYLMPALTRGDRSLYNVNIFARMDSSVMMNAGAVGTGVSCGVDSMHVLSNYMHSEYPGLKLTHLVLNNVGAYYRGAGDHQYAWQAEQARRFCSEFGLKLILTDSNIAAEIRQNHYCTHTYTSCFAIYALQKLWNVYFYASLGEDFSSFNLIDNASHEPGNYELLALDVFSTRALKIYSEGGAINRYDKVRHLIDFDPSHRYLHVCVMDEGPNCGHCVKCLRTLTALDALNALDKYRAVFNIDEYRAHRRQNLRWLYMQQVLKSGDKLSRWAYQDLCSQISLLDRLVAWETFLSVALSGYLKKIILNVKVWAIRSFPSMYCVYRRCFRKYGN